MPRSSFTLFKANDPVWYAPQGSGQKKEARFIRWTGEDRAEIQLLEDQLKGKNQTVSRSDLFSRDGTAPIAAPTPEELPPDDPATDPSNPLYKIVEVIDTVVKAIERTVAEATTAAESAKEKKLDLVLRAKTQLVRLAKARKALAPPLTPETPKKPRKKHVWSKEQREAASKRMTDINARRREEEAAESPAPKLAQTD